MRTSLTLRTRQLLAAAAVTLAALLARPVAPAEGGAAAVEVKIAGHRYEPRVITIARGATVRWVNEDDDLHTVTADDGAFASRGIDTHEAFTFTFPAAGTYAYHCALHPTMTGKVVVR